MGCRCAHLSCVLPVSLPVRSCSPSSVRVSREPIPVAPARPPARSGTAAQVGRWTVATVGPRLVPPDLAFPHAHPDHGRRGPGPPRRVGRRREPGSGRAHGLRRRLVHDVTRPVDVRRRPRCKGPRPTRPRRERTRRPDGVPRAVDPRVGRRPRQARNPCHHLDGLPAGAGQAARHRPALRDGRSHRDAGRRDQRLAPGAVPARPARTVLPPAWDGPARRPVRRGCQGLVLSAGGEAGPELPRLRLRAAPARQPGLRHRLDLGGRHQRARLPERRRRSRSARRSRPRPPACLGRVRRQLDPSGRPVERGAGRAQPRRRRSQPRVAQPAGCGGLPRHRPGAHRSHGLRVPGGAGDADGHPSARTATAT